MTRTPSVPARSTARRLASRAAWGAAAVALLAAPLGAALTRSGGVAYAEAAPARLPASAVDDAKSAAGLQTIVLSGGCFWGVQGVYEHVRGIRRAVAGYAGGMGATAHYDLVSTGTTGHAESVKITYDPRQISTGTLLQLFFSVAHDPTEVDRQGPDDGPQYRSEIWFTNPTQQKIATAYEAQLKAAHAFPRPFATKIEPLHGFYAAEPHHQDFLVLHPDHPYIANVDAPKIDALKRLYPALYRPDPVRSGLAGAA